MLYHSVLSFPSLTNQCNFQSTKNLFKKHILTILLQALYIPPSFPSFFRIFSSYIYLTMKSLKTQSSSSTPVLNLSWVGCILRSSSRLFFMISFVVNLSNFVQYKIESGYASVGFSLNGSAIVDCSTKIPSHSLLHLFTLVESSAEDPELSFKSVGLSRRLRLLLGLLK